MNRDLRLAASSLAVLVGLFTACSDPAPASTADGGDAAAIDDARDETASLDAAAEVDAAAVGDSATTDAATTADGAPSCKCGEPGCCPGVPDVECCAGATCPVKHDTGLGATYWYCGPLGKPGDASTYNEEMARRASQAWRSAGSPLKFTCGSGVGDAIENMDGSSSRANWVYSGSAAGRAISYISGGAGSMCPEATSSLTWN